jgi:hypothetical protein
MHRGVPAVRGGVRDCLIFALTALCGPEFGRDCLIYAMFCRSARAVRGGDVLTGAVRAPPDLQNLDVTVLKVPFS